VEVGLLTSEGRGVPCLGRRVGIVGVDEMCGGKEVWSPMSDAKLCAWEAGYANEEGPGFGLGVYMTAGSSADDANGVRYVNSRCRR